MKVFITGATGLIGANSALELLSAGHKVRLLVRNKAAARDYFLNHGYDLDDFIVADMLDKDAVKAGMQGCDAVLHSAAIVDLDARNAANTQATNLQSIDAVIGSACELGIKKILYVSSMSVYYDFSRAELNEETPLANVQDAYSLSKKLCEIRIRDMQAQGQPIISTYPAAVFGPNDPKLAESNGAMVKFVNTVMPLTTSGYQFVDARDIAIAHRKLLERELNSDKTQERYILGGHYISWPTLADLIEQAAGHKLRRLYIPGSAFRFLGSAFDAVRKLMPIAFPITKEGMRIVTLLVPASSQRILSSIDMQFRPAEQTITDTFDWMRDNDRFD